jgi:hypothetical protein
MRVRAIETFKYAGYRHGIFQIHSEVCKCNFKTGRKVVFTGTCNSPDELGYRLIIEWLNADWGYARYSPDDFDPDDPDPDVFIGVCLT